MNSHHCERSPRDASSRTWLPRSLESHAPELRRLHRWLDSWSGVGHIVAGMPAKATTLSFGATMAGAGARSSSLRDSSTRSLRTLAPAGH
jgi:hypothetical protein